MNSSLASALSEFSKSEWATEPLKDPPLEPTERNLVPRERSWLGKLAQILARYLIAFFIGVIATLAWQSYCDGSKIDKLAADITKVQDILEKISTPSRRSPARRSSQ